MAPSLLQENFGPPNVRAVLFKTNFDFDATGDKLKARAG